MNRLVKKMLLIEKVKEAFSNLIKRELLPINHCLSEHRNHLTSELTRLDKKMQLLCEEVSKLRETASKLEEEVKTLKKLPDNIKELEASLGCVAKRIKNSAKHKRIAFLIHNIAAIDALLPVINEAKRRQHYVFLIAIRNNFKLGGRNEKESQHLALSEMKLEHLQFETLSPGKGLEYLKALRPDVIFRQSPWDADIDDEFSTEYLRFSKICYTPYYGVQLLKHFSPKDAIDYHCDQEFHRNAWAIFVENTQEVIDNFKSVSLMKSTNLVLSGLPKYEYLFNQICGITGKEGATKTILWAPHHSFDTTWLGFGTFMNTYPTILKFLKENRDTTTLVFRPHPLFKKNLISSGNMTEERYDAVLKEFIELENFSLSSEADPHQDFQASDLLITDGISFLASYLLTDKPIIWIDSQRHGDFTAFGEKITLGSYHVGLDEISDLPDLIKSLLVKGEDPLREKREELKRILLGASKPSRNILDYIEENA
ncbi:CDP-glycerol glycerophosphotransferase family protein [Turicimonas muris]|uniref:CDP-glycerol glycerophosphotransferase family protein n=3 Tax=Turicimonas muris TaxID=1796652 RepID=UPI0026F4026A|nr:CDP-glycerol glycerophosphotransferase family protein [Turicimonas muris]